MKTKKLALAALLGAFAFTPFIAPAFAQDAPPPPAHGKKFDPAKHEEMKKKRWEKLDKDGNGAVTREEFLAANAERAEKAFERLDANKDGKVTREEMEAGKKKMHDRFKERMHKDADKNEGVK